MNIDCAMVTVVSQAIYGVGLLKKLAGNKG